MSYKEFVIEGALKTIDFEVDRVQAINEVLEMANLLVQAGILEGP